jgi:hypothetical protein
MAVVAAEESRAGERDIYVPTDVLGMAHRSYPSPDARWALMVEMARSVWLPCRVVPMDGSSAGRWGRQAPDAHLGRGRPTENGYI